MQFPIYRKYKNNKHFFKITSQTEFVELSFIGSKLLLTEHVATILPDKNFVYDLLHDVGNTCEASTKYEFEQQLTHK